MLWTIAVILGVMWLLGMVTSATFGGFLHLLLFLAIAVVLINVIRGRRPVWADASIKENVEKALKYDKSIEDVKIASVNQGVVLLSGKTPTLGAKLSAIEKALAVPGVRRVSSEIEAAEK